MPAIAEECFELGLRPGQVGMTVALVSSLMLGCGVRDYFVWVTPMTVIGGPLLFQRIETPLLLSGLSSAGRIVFL